MSDVIAKAIILENSTAVCMARVRKSDGTYVVQSDLTSVTANVYNLRDHSLAGTPTTTVAGTVYDSLQTTDARWLAAGGDSVGMNVAVTVDGSLLDVGNTTYQVEAKFLPASGNNAFYVVWQLQTKDILSA